MAWFACSFLMFELSTPFMIFVFRTIIKQKAQKEASAGSGRKVTDSDVRTAARLCGLVFFLVRMVWGNLYAVPRAWQLLRNP
jgi:hypothetical protein